MGIGKIGNNIFFSFILFDFKMLARETYNLNINASIFNLEVSQKEKHQYSILMHIYGI